MGIRPSESFVILYHEDMAAARRFYEEILGLALREVTYEWFVGYWISDKHEMTLCISSSPEERARWGAEGKGVVIDFVVPDVDEAYLHLVQRGVPFDEPPTDKPWGLRTASLRDPAGYTLTITSYLPGGRGGIDMSTENRPEDFMRHCLALAAEALEFGEFPIGAIVVLDDEIIGQGTATEQREQRFLGHAEMLALEQADKRHLSFDERGRSRLFTTLEPCLMCMGAAMSFFLGEIVYGLESPADGGVGLVRAWVRKKEDMPGYQVPKITGGLLREESVRLFEEYVARRPPGPMRDWAETLTKLRGNGC